MDCCKSVFLSVSLSMVSLTFFAFPSPPNRLLKPPNDRVLRICETLFPILFNGFITMSPDKASSRMPVTAPKTVSMRLLMSVPKPSFRISRMPSIAEIISPAIPLSPKAFVRDLAASLSLPSNPWMPFARVLATSFCMLPPKSLSSPRMEFPMPLSDPDVRPCKPFSSCWN